MLLCKSHFDDVVFPVNCIFNQMKIIRYNQVAAL